MSLPDLIAGGIACLVLWGLWYMWYTYHSPVFEPNLRYAKIFNKHDPFAQKLYERRDFTELIDYCTRSLAQKPGSIAARFWRVLAYEATGDFAAATADISHLIHQTPLDESLFPVRARLYHYQGKSAEALADYDQAIRRGHKTLDVYSSRSQVYRYLGRMDEAVADATVAIMSGAGNRATQSYLYRLRSDLYLAMEQFDKALDDCETALELQSSEVTNYLQRAVIYYQMKDYTACIVDADRVLYMTDGKYLDAYVTRADAYFAMKDTDAAMADCRQALSIQPDFVPAYISFSYYHYSGGQYEQAIAEATRAIELTQSRDIRPLLNRGLAYVQLKRFEAALDDYNTALTLAGIRDVRPLLNRGIAYFQAREYEAAIADFTAGFERSERKDARLLINRMHVYARQGEWEKAGRDVDQAIVLASPAEKPNYVLYKAHLLRLQKRYDEALVLHNQVLADAPDMLRGWNNRAYLLAHMGRLDEALADVQKALSLDASYQNIWGTRGEIYFLLGQYNEAQAAFTKSLELKPDHTFAIAGQSITQHAMGNIEAAQTIWRRLIDLDTRYQTVDALIEDYHPAEAFVDEARKVIAGLENAERN